MKTIVAYIPALHRGYLEFLNRNPGAALYLLDRAVLEEFGELHLERDIRAVPPETMRAALNGVDSLRSVLRNVACAGSTELERLGSGAECIVMPDEDISHRVAEKYFASRYVVYDTAFLRWDKNRTLLDADVPADRTISRQGFVTEMMRRAETEAEKSSNWWRHVGAVAAYDGEILVTAYNEQFPNPHALYFDGDPRANFDLGEHIERAMGPHAEILLAAKAARDGISLKGADLFITVFPCRPCAVTVVVSGIARVYFTTGSNNLDALDVLRNANVEVVRVK